METCFRHSDTAALVFEMNDNIEANRRLCMRATNDERCLSHTTQNCLKAMETLLCIQHLYRVVPDDGANITILAPSSGTHQTSLQIAHLHVFLPYQIESRSKFCVSIAPVRARLCLVLRCKF